MRKLLTASHPWFIWILAAGFFFAEYFARIAPSVMVPDLMRTFHVGALSLGSLSAFFYYAYVAMQIPVGTLVDRYGAHKLLTVTAAICGISCFLFARTESLFLAESSRFLMGFSASFAFVGTLKLVSIWFPASRFGLLSGATQALGMLGAAVGSGPVSLIVANYGWRNTMFFIGGVLLLLSLSISIIVRDKPKHHVKDAPVVHEPRYSILASLWQVLQNPQTWINGVIVGFLYAPTAAFAELWGASYLHRVYDITPEVAASAISMIFIGWAIGGPIGGLVSDSIKRRKPIIITSITLSLIFMASILYLPNLPIIVIFGLLFLYGFSNMGVATCYAVACEINHKKIAGTSMGFANMSSVIIGAAFQPIIGWLLDLQWDHSLVDGVPFYTAHDFRMAMLALPLCFIISLIVIIFLKESYK